MGEPIKECWDRRQYHTGLAHIKRNRRTQFGISGAAIKPKWDGPTYPKGMTQLTNVAGPTLVKPAGPLQVSGLKILTSTQRHFGYSINVQIPRLNVKTCEIPHFFFIYWPHLLTTFLVTSDTDDRYLQDVEIPDGCLCLMLTCWHGWSAERGYWQSALLVQYWYQKTCVHADREHGTDVWQHQTQQTCYLVNP